MVAGITAGGQPLTTALPEVLREDKLTTLSMESTVCGSSVFCLVALTICEKENENG